MSPQYISNIFDLQVGEIAHLLTIDPNFQRDIQVGWWVCRRIRYLEGTRLTRDI